jgi:hypothetical protein
MSTRRGLIFLAGPAVALLAMLLVSLAGCQAVFTYTPLTFLQRPPSSLPPAQQLEYAQNALASGDKSAMAAALLVIQNDPSPAAQYTAAELGIEVSGVPQLLLDVVNGTQNLTSESSIAAYMNGTSGVQPGYLIDAAARVANLAATDPSALQPMDYVYGALGLALDAADTNGTIDFTTIVPGDPKPTAALAFINTAIATLPPGDPTQAFLSGFASTFAGFV